MRKKRCQCCHELYEPEPRSRRRQKTCKKPACRAWRKRRAVQSWKQNNPLYPQTEPVTYTQWCKRNPCYWRQWRKRHPGYVARNRRAQRGRNARNRTLIAKGNDLKSICIDKLRQNASVRLIAKGNDWQRVVEYRLDGICRYLKGQLLIAKGNDIDTKGIFVRKYEY